MPDHLITPPMSADRARDIAVHFNQRALPADKPANFKRPLYSFMGDWVMYKDMWQGKVSL